MKNQNPTEVISKNIFEADTKLSHMEWTGKKIGGEHHGTISLSKGEVRYDGMKISGTFEINMSSISTTDLSGEWKEKLDGHLKSEDFFSTEKYPKAVFEITGVTGNENNKLVKGNLTIKEKTNPIEFNANIKIDKEKITCEGIAVIDRTKFDVRYASKSFFGNIGDKMIYDEFTVKFNIVTIK